MRPPAPPALPLFALLLEILKTELPAATGLAVGRGPPAVEGWEVPPRSKRPLELVATEEADMGFRAALNSPKPSEALEALRTVTGARTLVVLGGAAAAGLGGGLGPVSKKPPPLSGGEDVTCGGTGVDFVLLEAWPIDAKGEAFAAWDNCGVWLAEGTADAELEPKPRPPKASFKSPNADGFGVAPPGCPPKEG